MLKLLWKQNNNLLFKNHKRYFLKKFFGASKQSTTSATQNIEAEVR